MNKIKKIAFRLCIQSVYEIQINCAFILGSYPLDISLSTCKYSKTKKTEIQKLKKH